MFRDFIRSELIANKNLIKICEKFTIFVTTNKNIELSIFSQILILLDI